jgi:deoxyribodipyrimidine photo-lyase
MKIGIHWFRCDLRLSDNSALHAAVAGTDAVIPIFIFDPAILRASSTGAPQVAYMLRTLAGEEHRGRGREINLPTWEGR